MTTIRRTFIAALAATTLATSSLAPVNQAHANPWGEVAQQQVHRHHVQRHVPRHRHSNGKALATGLAVGVGLAILGTAIAAQQRRQRDADSHAHIHRDAQRDGWTDAVQHRHDCHVLQQYRQLLASAKEAKRRDEELTRKYGAQVHSPQHAVFSQQLIEERQAKIREYEKRCAPRRAARF